ncbi:DNA polymerase III subunit beta [Thalassotalea sp. 1_MG-2023]|uniref:DNA polymerase III subunit beta n=1 Tax=Thalassotalea sp. 1_MG-2023 TaxID=3062680 RepID=UPI0026E40B36|nr:DNA polymerase III subunit beta [Thalassotalea sp. 1_MG-2023]MDO6427639.1 DNA polymerase III subunit beta [Thalassotalea sp. 1_MG-2023]
MKFSLNRELLLKPLLLVSGAVERKSTLPILGNVLIEVSEQSLTLTATDLELEMVAYADIDNAEANGKLTIPARKLLDICKSLPDGALISFESTDDTVTISSGRSKYSLSTLPATDFPNIEEWKGDVEFKLSKAQLLRLIESTHFSMANQDVRYYLNGMSIETEANEIRSVATDGHRLAICKISNDELQLPNRQVIVPRKGILEIIRLLDPVDEEVQVFLGSNHIRIIDTEFSFTSKLVDGRFPDYRRVLPRNGDKILNADKDQLKQVLSRASILSNEKFKGVRLNFADSELKITANNPEQEQAEEILEVNFPYEDVEIGFNVNYVLDVLNAIKEQGVKFTLADANSSVVIEGQDSNEALYVVMPMRL